MLTIRTPFTFEDGGVATVSNVDNVVKQEIVSYFMTSSGERVMNSTFGGNLSSLVFEINDPLILADYKVDNIPNVNSNLSFGKVLDMTLVEDTASAQNAPYDAGVLPVVVRYAVSPRNVSTVRLNVNIPFFTQESDL